MCQVSDKLKLCTCHGDKSWEELESFWELYHNINGDGGFQFFIGTPMMPLNMFICGEFSEANEDLIMHLLNEGNCFDFPYEPKERDCLELFLKPVLPTGIQVPTGYMDRLYYSFQFIDGRWVSEYLKLYELDPRFRKVKRGEVQNAFETAARESDLSPLWKE